MTAPRRQTPRRRPVRKANAFATNFTHFMLPCPADPPSAKGNDQRPTWVWITKEASAEGVWGFIQVSDIMDGYQQQNGYVPDLVQPMIVRAWAEATGEAELQLAPNVDDNPSIPFIDNGGFAVRAHQSFGFPNNLRSFLKSGDGTKVAFYKCAQKVTFQVQVLAWKRPYTPPAPTAAVNWADDQDGEAGVSGVESYQDQNSASTSTALSYPERGP